MSGGEIARIVIGSIAGIGVIWGIIKYILDRKQKKKIEQDKKLKTHFEDLKREIVDPITSIIGGLRNLGGRLGSDYRSSGSYIFWRDIDFDFEKDDLFLSFELHFPERVAEWRELKEKAIKHNKIYKEFRDHKVFVDLARKGRESEKARTEVKDEELDADLEKAPRVFEETEKALIDNAQGLIKQFKEFSRKLREESGDIAKYGPGRRFKKVKHCPICQKF